MPLKVLYDTANLGSGIKGVKIRTGIARVIEELACALVSANACDLTFCASQYSGEARQAIRNNPQLSHLPFLYSGGKQWIADRLLALTQEIVQASPGAAAIPLRVQRKAFSLVDGLAGQSAFPFDPRALGHADVYHSTFHPLPTQVKRAKAAKFLTVYDLIPILKPQYYGADSLHYAGFLQRSLGSLGPEDMALCISQSTKDDFCACTKHDPTRAVVTYLAADSALFYPCHEDEIQEQTRRKYSLPRQPYLLSLSTLEPRKNIAHVIRCFARLASQEDTGELCLVLAGSKGWDYGSIFDELDAAQDVKDRIIITGRVDDADLAALYSGALAFVYMSHYEGFGLPPLEAMQCGVPVITSNTSSLPEVVGDAGIMLDPSDADGLCQSLLRVCRDAPLRAAMGQKSLERARLFSWERCARETVAAYQASLAGHA